MVFLIKLVDFLVKSVKQIVIAGLAGPLMFFLLVWKFADWFMLVRANLDSGAGPLYARVEYN